MTRQERWEEAFDPPFDIRGRGAPGSAFVLASPHSGSIYPQDFLDLSRLPATVLRRSEDAHVDALAAPAAEALGAPLIAARFPRAFLDVNREALELDPRLVEGPLPEGANSRSLRVTGGLGVAPRVVGDGLPIYDGRLTLDHVLDRVARLHAPYHAALDALMARAESRFGVAILIDCHSMPAIATQRAAGRRLDVVLGDRFGASADPGLVEAMEESFLAEGLRTARNKPYAGGYTTERNGRPRAGRHAIQVELARDLYMDERTLERSPGFPAMAAALARACLSALAAARDLGPAPRLAAE